MFSLLLLHLDEAQTSSCSSCNRFCFMNETCAILWSSICWKFLFQQQKKIATTWHYLIVTKRSRKFWNQQEQVWPSRTGDKSVLGPDQSAVSHSLQACTLMYIVLYKISNIKYRYPMTLRYARTLLQTRIGSKRSLVKREVGEQFTLYSKETSEIVAFRVVSWICKWDKIIAITTVSCALPHPYAHFNVSFDFGYGLVYM